jgi:hypothetical protein
MLSVVFPCAADRPVSLTIQMTSTEKASPPVKEEEKKKRKFLAKKVD